MEQLHGHGQWCHLESLSLGKIHDFSVIKTFKVNKVASFPARWQGAVCECLAVSCVMGNMNISQCWCCVVLRGPVPEWLQRTPPPAQAQLRPTLTLIK